mgnify:FL=1
MAGELSMTKTGTVTLRIIATAASALAMSSQGFAQDNATPNGVADDRNNAYAYTNATIYQTNGEFLQDGTMLVSNGEIVEINSSAAAPEGYFEIDLEGDFIYPGFIDAYSGYGMPEVESESGRSFRSAEVMF